MRTFICLLLAASFFIPANAAAVDSEDGFLDSGSLFISQKMKTVPLVTKPLAPLHGFFEQKTEVKSFSNSGSVVLGGSVSRLNPAAKKAPLLGFFQNDIPVDPKTALIFDTLSKFSSSGSIVVSGRF